MNWNCRLNCTQRNHTENSAKNCWVIKVQWLYEFNILPFLEFCNFAVSTNSMQTNISAERSLVIWICQNTCVRAPCIRVIQCTGRFFNRKDFQMSVFSVEKSSSTLDDAITVKDIIWNCEVTSGKEIEGKWLEDWKRKSDLSIWNDLGIADNFNLGSGLRIGLSGRGKLTRRLADGKCSLEMKKWYGKSGNIHRKIAVSVAFFMYLGYHS